VIGKVVGLFDGRQVQYPARLHGDSAGHAEAICG